MTVQAFDEERFNGEIRKFLKRVGITSQIEMERAAREAFAQGRLDPGKPLRAQLVLEVPGIGLRHVVEQDLALG